MFNFNAPNFIFRFALGETDYQQVTDYEHFAAEYNYLGRDVWQQTLSLTEEEKRLITLTVSTTTYRSRYATLANATIARPRDQIERAINGTLQYADNMTDNSTGISFRDLLHKYSEGHLWSRFGMDSCMGSKTRRTINRRLAMVRPSTCGSISVKRRLWTKKDKHGHWLPKKKKS